MLTENDLRTERGPGTERGPRTERPSAVPRLRLTGADVRRRRLLGGGPDGNELLTTANGAILIVLLGVLGLTILFMGQLLWVHLFVGLLLLGPVSLKLASTGYRFVRYYTGEEAYRLKGPPVTPLRVIAPLVVALTVIVFATGVALLVVGPGQRSLLLLAHKASFIVWLLFMSVHVLGHLPEVLRMLVGGRRPATGARHQRRSAEHRRPQRPRALSGAGSGGRAISLAGALVGGFVLAIALAPEFSAWTAHAFHHHG
jgi:hypothetical protein